MSQGKVNTEITNTKENFYLFGTIKVSKQHITSNLPSEQRHHSCCWEVVVEDPVDVVMHSFKLHGQFSNVFYHYLSSLTKVPQYHWHRIHTKVQETGYEQCFCKDKANAKDNYLNNYCNS